MEFSDCPYLADDENEEDHILYDHSSSSGDPYEDEDWRFAEYLGEVSGPLEILAGASSSDLISLSSDGDMSISSKISTRQLMSLTSRESRSWATNLSAVTNGDFQASGFKRNKLEPSLRNLASCRAITEVLRRLQRLRRRLGWDPRALPRLRRSILDEPPYLDIDVSRKLSFNGNRRIHEKALGMILQILEDMQDDLDEFSVLLSVIWRSELEANASARAYLGSAVFELFARAVKDLTAASCLVQDNLESQSPLRGAIAESLTGEAQELNQAEGIFLWRHLGYPRYFTFAKITKSQTQTRVLQAMRRECRAQVLEYLGNRNDLVVGHEVVSRPDTSKAHHNSCDETPYSKGTLGGGGIVPNQQVFTEVPVMARKERTDESDTGRRRYGPPESAFHGRSHHDKSFSQPSTTSRHESGDACRTYDQRNAWAEIQARLCGLVHHTSGGRAIDESTDEDVRNIE